VAQEQLAGLGERDRTRPARAFDELLSDDLLEGCDLLADGRLRVAEAVGRATDPSRATASSAAKCRISTPSH
jgi:hypothetical protein